MHHREKPWEYNQDLTAKEVKKIIEINFSELRINSIKPLGSGWDNTTWLVNNEWVFRLPKHREAATLIKNEINLLPHLKNLTVIIPTPEFICLNPKIYPFPIYAHQFIHGTNSDKANLTDNERIRLVQPIAQFLKRLHNFSLTEAKKLNIEYDRIGRLMINPRIEKLEYQINYLAQHQLIKNASLFIDYYKAHRNIQVPDIKVLGHGDFYARHILLDEKKQFQAVIDWGDSELLHPAVDLAIVYQFFPIYVHDEFWQSYGSGDETTKILAQLRAIYSISGMGWYAHSVKDDTLLKESIDSLARLTKVIT